MRPVHHYLPAPAGSQAVQGRWSAATAYTAYTAYTAGTLSPVLGLAGGAVLPLGAGAVLG